MHMSEIAMDEPSTELAGVVELGNASEETRGSAGLMGLLDGGIIWPLIFYHP
jgi:hypothetical protein